MKIIQFLRPGSDLGGSPPWFATCGNLTVNVGLPYPNEGF